MKKYPTYPLFSYRIRKENRRKYHVINRWYNTTKNSKKTKVTIRQELVYYLKGEIFPSKYVWEMNWSSLIGYFLWDNIKDLPTYERINKEQLYILLRKYLWELDPGYGLAIDEKDARNYNTNYLRSFCCYGIAFIECTFPFAYITIELIAPLLSIAVFFSLLPYVGEILPPIDKEIKNRDEALLQLYKELKNNISDSHLLQELRKILKQDSDKWGKFGHLCSFLLFSSIPIFGIISEIYANKSILLNLYSIEPTTLLFIALVLLLIFLSYNIYHKFKNIDEEIVSYNRRLDSPATQEELDDGNSDWGSWCIRFLACLSFTLLFSLLSIPMLYYNIFLFFGITLDSILILIPIITPTFIGNFCFFDKITPPYNDNEKIIKNRTLLYGGNILCVFFVFPAISAAFSVGIWNTGNLFFWSLGVKSTLAATFAIGNVVLGLLITGLVIKRFWDEYKTAERNQLTYQL